MAYADRKMSGSRVVALVIVALIHALIGYAFVTGLAYQYVKKAAENLDKILAEQKEAKANTEAKASTPERAVTGTQSMTMRPCGISRASSATDWERWPPAWTGWCTCASARR